MISDDLTYEQLTVENTLVKYLGNVAKVEGGFMKDFVRKVLIAKDQWWWNKMQSPWKITAWHQSEPPPEPGMLENYSPDYWQKRVLDLCTFDIVRNNFGLNYLDLMQLDVPTFETIEERVHKIADKQREAIEKATKPDPNQNPLTQLKVKK